MLTDDQIETAAHHFISAAIWANCPDGTHPRATRKAHETAYAFVRRFTKAYPNLCKLAMECDGYAAAAFGHDLFLTCAGHGAAFIDCDSHVGAALTQVIRENWRLWHIETRFYRGWMYLHVSA